MHLDAGHLAERFGLFVLIAIGESVVAIGTSATSEQGPGLAVGSAVVAAFVLSAGLWWVYFHFAADAMRHAMSTARVQLDITRLVLSYGHLSFVGSVIVVSVGMHEAVAEPGTRLGWGLTGLLFGGTALYLATFGFTRWAMFRLVSWTRLTAAAVVMVLAARGVPAGPRRPHHPRPRRGRAERGRAGPGRADRLAGSTGSPRLTITPDESALQTWPRLSRPARLAFARHAGEVLPVLGRPAR